jgi:poly(3-hydroxybutyrate) depolymerase
MVKRTRAATAAALALAVSASAAAAGVEKRTVVSRGTERAYYVLVPATLAADRPAPLIVMLHGSGRTGKQLLEIWRGLAEQEGILLAGPDSTDSLHWAAPQDGPLLLRDVVDAVAKEHPVDPRRIYLFGNSAGAVFALQVACLESEFFAAAAVHAGAVDPKFFSVFDYAARKIPIGIWTGTRDKIFPVADVRATAKALTQRGFPVTLTEIPDHTHDYSAVSADVNPAIWAFLSSRSLSEDARFRVYADPK